VQPPPTYAGEAYTADQPPAPAAPPRQDPVEQLLGDLLMNILRGGN
jgi:hypothetical protein